MYDNNSQNWEIKKIVGKRILNIDDIGKIVEQLSLRFIYSQKRKKIKNQKELKPSPGGFGRQLVY